MRFQFVERQLKADAVRGRSVLDVGSRDPQSRVRNIVMPLRPEHYTGADLAPGPGVDVVCPAEVLLDRFAPASFDVVVCTEVLEHVRDWRAVVHNIKTVLREDGIVVLTTRSPGFHFHGYPLDFWRFDPEDISEIFGDFKIEALELDTGEPPGVFVRARRPQAFTERHLHSYPVYSVVRRRRAKTLTRLDIAGSHSLAMGRATAGRALPLSARAGIRRGLNWYSRRAVH